MKNVTSGIVIATIGAIALSGGVTFALWNTGHQVTAGILTTGELDVEKNGSPTWADTSVDVEGNPSPINPSTWRFAEGDTASMRQRVLITATGSNLDSRLTVSVPALTGPLTAGTAVDASYSLLDSRGLALPGADSVPVGTPTNVVGVKTGTYTVEIDLAFGTGYTSKNGSATLGEAVIRLEQVRPEKG